MYNTRSVQLTKKFGSWPVHGYEGLSEDAKTEFWNNLKDCKGTGDIQKLVDSSITASTTTHQSTDFEGDWLPLGVWANQGWDPAEIERTEGAENKKQKQQMV